MCGRTCLGCWEYCFVFLQEWLYPIQWSRCSNYSGYVHNIAKQYNIVTWVEYENVKRIRRIVCKIYLQRLCLVDIRLNSYLVIWFFLLLQNFQRTIIVLHLFNAISVIFYLQKITCEIGVGIPAKFQISQPTNFFLVTERLFWRVVYLLLVLTCINSLGRTIKYKIILMNN